MDYGCSSLQGRALEPGPREGGTVRSPRDSRGQGRWERGQRGQSAGSGGKAEQPPTWLSTELLSRAAKNLLPGEKGRMRAPVRMKDPGPRTPQGLG